VSSEAVIAAYPIHRLYDTFDVWSALFWVNLIVAIGIAIALIRSHKRAKEERSPANLTPFFADEQLEGPRLERVLGWSLFFFTIFAISLPLYWLDEAHRQEASVKYFSDNAARRGQELFSNESMVETFNPAKSLKCADCHGAAGVGGGGAPYTYKDPKTGKAYSVTWRAPALNTVLYRFSPAEVHDILTYGRQGTPMQAWGVPGGGPKNEQSINDLVAYIRSIQLPPGTSEQISTDLAGCQKNPPVQPKTATGVASCALDSARKQADDQVKAAKKTLDAATADAAAHTKDYADKKCGTAGMAPADASACANLAVQTQKQPFYTTSTDQAAVEKAQRSYDWALQWQKDRAGVGDGQLLFELNCARCHTKNWSIFDPSNVDLKPTDLLGPPGGGGSIGPNLRDGQEQRRFPDTLSVGGKPKPNSGILSQIAFVMNGSEAFKQYGVGGQGSGKMPGQCNNNLQADPTVTLLNYGCMLTHTSDTEAGPLVTTDNPATPYDDVMIEQIVLYERCGLDLTDTTLKPPPGDYTTGCS
jgi:mono/diheme cytochrome c family protein